MTTKFKVDYINKYGSNISRELACFTGVTAEHTFKNCLDILPKFIRKNWESIQFAYDGRKCTVIAYWLKEAGGDFSKSHTFEL